MNCRISIEYVTLNEQWIRVIEKTTLLFSVRISFFFLRKLLKYPSSKVMNYPKIERSFLEILSIFRVLDAFLTTPTSMLNRIDGRSFVKE